MSELLNFKQENAETPAGYIKVVGYDPSFRNWGYAFGYVNLESKEILIEKVLLVTTERDNHKSVRRNSDDLKAAVELKDALVKFPQMWGAKLSFSEIPTGAQSANAAKGLGIALGVLASNPLPLIQVLPAQVKEAFVGDKKASKRDMIERAYKLHPKAKGWKLNAKKIPTNDMEHVADAVASIYAGVQSKQFEELVLLYKGMNG